jgi:hypothetical protein
MLSLLQSAPLVFVASLLVGFSDNARAENPEPLVPAVDTNGGQLESSEPVVRCVTLADGVLDLRIMADVSDIWSIDANASVGGAASAPTLYVVSSGSTLSLSVRFDKLSDQIKIPNGQGGGTTLAPTSTRDAVKATVALSEGQSLTIDAFAADSTQALDNPTKPVGATNKAVIKRVTICPT